VIYGSVRLGHPTGEHQCCRVAWLDGGYERCGLLCLHDGDCMSRTPGGYLGPPLITPLTWLAARMRSRWPWMRCPLCGEWLNGSEWWPTYVTYADVEEPEREEVRWEFWPCGCEGREIVEDETAPACNGGRSRAEARLL
jgi:hypothetical protein